MPREPDRRDASSVDRPGDPWASLRRTTPARIGLGRTGDALALAHVLDLQIGHAKARDAVHVPLDVDRIEAGLGARSRLRVRSQAPDRSVYLKRPDYGRRLDPACRERLDAGAYDAVFIIADGLSAVAVEAHATNVLDATLAHLGGWSFAPIVIATQARVALADEIGERLGAALSVILIGERPGLSAADSLGAYLTFGPRPGRRDSERNCISNIHAAGLRVDLAAAKLAWLMTEARRRCVTGIALKDDMPEPMVASNALIIERKINGSAARDAS